MNPAKNFASAPGQLSREAVNGPPSERSTAGRNPCEVDGRRSFRSSEGAHERPVAGIRFISHPKPQQNGQPQSADATKKGGAKTKGRGRKAAQPEPQPQPPEGEDYGFSDDIPF
ncbi:single-stranded DNA-binding protein [Shigella flexneri]|nr:single-stranded DNA-binding protein [Shigella flexneri]